MRRHQIRLNSVNVKKHGYNKGGKNMYLRMILLESISGYWDGGKKNIFNWHIDGTVKEDKQGKFVKIGYWEANHWFHVALSKTMKMTLANAKRRLKHTAPAGTKFEYVEE